jgi:endonuclease/exonuclease/phosphatase (EEP) superfamily protein YafD
LFFANILGTNANYNQLLMAMRKAEADILLLVEVRRNHLEQLLPALADYPFHFAQPDVKNFGLAIFSRLPLESVQALTLDETCTPALVARIQQGETSFMLLAIHPYPPKSRSQAAQRDHQLELTTGFVTQQPGELILAGDLNSTSWSHAFQQLLNDSHLLDSRQGIGLQPSWPAGYPMLRVPIDHVLHTPGITIHRRQLGLRIGSDHLPIIVDFSIEG